MCMNMRRNQKDLRVPEDGVIGTCESPDMDAGNQTVLWKSSKGS